LVTAVNTTKNPSILLVEDDVVVALTRTAFLETHGFTLFHVTTGEAALEVLKSKPRIALVLMDVRLGAGIDGIETATRILRELDVPIIFLTGHTDTATADQVRQIPSYGYLPADCPETVLLTTIEVALRVHDSIHGGRSREFALWQQEAPFRSLVSNIPGAAYRSEIDPPWRFNLVTYGIHALTGRKPFEFESGMTTWGSTIHEDDLLAVEQAFARSRDNDKPYDLQYRITSADGETRWVRDRGSLVVDDSGNPIYREGVVTDTTERHRDEAALMESEERYKTLFDTMSHGVVYQTSEGKIVGVNHAAENILGVSRSEMIGMDSVNSDWGSIREDGTPFPGAEHPVMIALRTGRPVFGVVMGLPVKSENIVRWLLIDAIPEFRPGESTPYRAYTIFNDITMKRRMEEATRARARLLELSTTQSLQKLLQATLDEAELLTGSSIGFYHFVGPDQKSLSLQTWSTNTVRTMCSMEVTERHYPLDKAGVWADCLRTRSPLMHNDYQSLPHKRGYPEGHAHVARELVVPVIRGDKVKAMLGVGNKKSEYDSSDLDVVSHLADLAWDIVEQKRLDEALQRELAQKRAFLHEFQHRVKNSLMMISSLASLESGRAKLPETRNALGSLQHRISAVANLYAMLSDATSMESVSLDSYLGRIIKAVIQSILPSDAITIEQSLAPVVIDIKRAIPLGLILNELLTNTMKYAFPDGRAGSVHISLVSRDRTVLLEVRDNGVGFPDEKRTGLGLTLVKLLGEELRGTSTHVNDGGTRFTIEFPFTPSDRE
jgi:PAS domain S-box-containing protein